MATRGFLIRFIDIGLIVLFGFLMISDIDASSRVELAGAQAEIEEPPEEPDEQAMLIVEITAMSSFRVSDPAAAGVEPVTVVDADALTETLRTLSRIHAEQGLETVVLIQPHQASVVQATIDAMDACDLLDLAKSLSMDIELDPPGGPEAPEEEGRDTP